MILMDNPVRLKLVAILVLFLSLAACGGKFQAYPTQVVQSGSITKEPVAPPQIPTDPSHPAVPATPPVALKFCSPLSFENIHWDPNMNLNSQRAFAIGLSISGGFEGGEGWSNLSNNFDGMGMSAGLLNQTLGTESLQPLLEQITLDHRIEVASVLTADHLQSLISMLNAWNPSVHIQDFHVSEIQTASVVNSSVQWAVDNLYQANGNFHPDWKQQLQSLLSTSDFINLQVDAALKYHLKAMRYLQRIRYKDLRAYLLMLDIIIQNGSISESRFQEWESKIAQDGITDEVTSLKALVEIRLQDTKPQWRGDVRSRKYSLIDGVGNVHGQNWNLPKSFCYGLSDPAQ